MATELQLDREPGVGQVNTRLAEPRFLACSRKFSFNSKFPQPAASEGGLGLARGLAG